MIFLILQIAGILIPAIGMFALILDKRRGDNVLLLALTDMACLIMNSGYYLMMRADSDIDSLAALKMAYLGNASFYVAFILFMLSYMNMIVPKPLMWIWVIFEGAMVGFFWNDALREKYFAVYSFDELAGSLTETASPKVLFIVRYAILGAIILTGLIYVAVKMFKTTQVIQRLNLARLCSAQFVVFISLAVQLITRPAFNIIPIISSLAILAVILSVIADEFFGISDSGNEWAFQQMEDAFILTDINFGFVSANRRALDMFPELEDKHPGEKLSDELTAMFNASETNWKIGRRFYEKKVTEIVRGMRTVGYGVLLDDDTDQMERAELLANYNTELENEVALKTAHIQNVQDSIITGLAKVVESRDNSTGGHIERTSLIIRTFSTTLVEHAVELGITRQFVRDLIKAAPMHDIGKIGVDDYVLRKPGNFTDEEYSMMKSHSAKGAAMLGTVLSEVDDENFVNIAINVAHYHHERWDGKGYPKGLSGEDIPIEARIMALADVLDALLSKRYYKEAFSFEKAIGIIADGLGTQFDPIIGRLFVDNSDDFRRLYENIT
ncbi:MAG: HD domain-containing protein [Ruminococcus sp.]|nr:HD domain-containing protein [Ruminococcus sp.]